MKVCCQCDEVADLNRFGQCEACEYDEQEEDEIRSELDDDQPPAASGGGCETL